MAERKLTLSLYRGLLRVARSIDASVPPGMPVMRILSVSSLPSELQLSPANLGGSSASEHAKVTAQLVVKRAMRAAAHCGKTGEIAPGKMLDMGFRALREAHKRKVALSSPLPCTMETVLHGRPGSVAFAVGQVVYNRLHGYRGVIIGWHTSCQASPEWMEKHGVENTSQPFYLCLVDTRDRPEASVAYIAQSNCELVSDAVLPAQSADAPGAASNLVASHPPVQVESDACAGDGGVVSSAASTVVPQTGALGPTDRFIVHPLVSKYFVEFRPEQGYFVPGDALTSHYFLDMPADFGSIKMAASSGSSMGEGSIRSTAMTHAPLTSLLVEGVESDNPEDLPSAGKVINKSL